MMIALPVTLAVFAGWKRARYFGNLAPLGIAMMLVVMGMAAPSFPGEGFQLAALAFLLLFVAGVLADLLESRRGAIVGAGLAGLLMASALWNLLELIRAARS